MGWHMTYDILHTAYSMQHMHVACTFLNHSKDTYLVYLMHSYVYFDSLLYLDSSYLLL